MEENRLASIINRKRKEINKVDETIGDLNNYVGLSNKNDKPIIQKKEPKVEINISDYDIFTKLSNMDGNDYSTIMVYLLELHLMGQLDRIEKINLPESTRKRILEKMGSFANNISNLLSGE